MPISWSSVEAIAPELSSVAAGTQTLILAMVDRQIDDIRWGEFADDGRRYLAAHLGTITNGGAAGGSAGPVISETLGPMSRSYGQLNASWFGALGTTKYGVIYAYIMNIACGPAVIVP